MGTKSIAIIPARHDSKGVKGKNFKIFNGKPLISWTIDFVRSLKFIDYAVISSDSEKIRKISRDNNFNFILRPENLSLDTSSTEECIIHVIKELSKKNKYFDYIFIFEPTTPLRKKKTVIAAFNFLQKNNLNSLMTVAKTDKLLANIKKNKFSPIQKNTSRRRQERVPLFYEVGVVYILKNNFFLKKNKIVSINTFPYLVNNIESLDINTKEDFLQIKILHKEIFLRK
tara:strand:- start:156 stop:839 length:684 start_codon:yes stop_codon:yes gene_type:complete